jgi:hypothetical protein
MIKFEIKIPKKLPFILGILVKTEWHTTGALIDVEGQFRGVLSYYSNIPECHQ